MAIAVWIDGELFDERTAVVSVFDRGFLYGDSVYEVTRTIGGRPVDLKRHLDRLDASAAAIFLASPRRAEVEAAIARTLAASGNADSYLRVILTRGAGEIGLDPAYAERPKTILIVKPLVLPAADLYRDGVAVALVSVLRNSRRAVDPAVKSGNYLNNILALAEGKRGGKHVHEAIMQNAAGQLVEGSSSNLFVVRDRVVRTPALEGGLLAGITRRRVLELAREAGLATDETVLLPDDLRAADEAFLTSSLRGVLPVVRVDDRPIGSGAPGEVTSELMRRYEEFLASCRDCAV